MYAFKAYIKDKAYINKFIFEKFLLEIEKIVKSFDM